MADHDGTNLKLLNDSEPPSVFELRGYHVMLAAKVAEVFEVETRQIVQNIKKNNKKDPPLFPERYAFEITKQEHLKSLGVIPKPGRGGSRALPWVITRNLGGTSMKLKLKKLVCDLVIKSWTSPYNL